MDSGWAVILGAFIALTGSALIPWLRDSRAEARAREERAAVRRREALVDLIAKNSDIGMALTFEDTPALLAAFGPRSEAATRLLLEVTDEERKELLPLLQGSVPLRDGEDQGIVGLKMNSLQTVLVRWASGELETSQLRRRYLELIGKKKA